MTTSETLRFSDLRAANLERCGGAFHPLDEWSPTDWSNAMAGECGEACNLVKKLRRQVPAAALPAEWDKAIERDACLLVDIGKELADVVIYADLLAARLGINLGEVVREKFNEVSARVGSEVQL